LSRGSWGERRGDGEVCPRGDGKECRRVMEELVQGVEFEHRPESWVRLHPGGILVVCGPHLHCMLPSCLPRVVSTVEVWVVITEAMNAEIMRGKLVFRSESFHVGSWEIASLAFSKIIRAKRTGGLSSSMKP
jgi:hypothetical protein